MVGRLAVGHHEDPRVVAVEVARLVAGLALLDQLERWQAGKLADEEFRPLRLQNGWYVQRYAPMLRVAVPYGEIRSDQLRALARIAREFDRPDDSLWQTAQDKQDKMSSCLEVPTPA